MRKPLFLTTNALKMEQQQEIKDFVTTYEPTGEPVRLGYIVKTRNVGSSFRDIKVFEAKDRHPVTLEKLDAE